jgi:hypothetical protein
LQDLNLVVAEISQITESAGYVVVGGSGSTDKFEIGNVKTNALLVVVHY